MRVELNSKSVKRFNEKTDKFFMNLYIYYYVKTEGIFYKYGKKYLRRSVRQLAKDIDCSIGFINKMLTWMKEEGLIEYGFINTDGNRKHCHERMCIYITPKGRVFMEDIKKDNDRKNRRKEAISKYEKRVNDRKAKAVKLNNKYINKSSDEGIFKKHNDSLTGIACKILRDYGYECRFTVGLCRYIHAGLKLLGKGDESNTISRFKLFISKITSKYGKISIHRLFNYGFIKRYFAVLASEITYYETQDARKKYQTSNLFINNSEKEYQTTSLFIIKNPSRGLTSIGDILSNFKFTVSG